MKWIEGGGKAGNQFGIRNYNNDNSNNNHFI